MSVGCKAVSLGYCLNKILHFNFSLIFVGPLLTASISPLAVMFLRQGDPIDFDVKDR